MSECLSVSALSSSCQQTYVARSGTDRENRARNSPKRVEAALTILQNEMTRQIGYGPSRISYAQLAADLGIAERKLRGIACGQQRPCLDEALDIAAALPEPCINQLLGCYDWGGAHKLDADATPHALEVAASATEFATAIIKAHSPASPGGTAFVSAEKRDTLRKADALIDLAISLRRDLTPS